MTPLWFLTDAGNHFIMFIMAAALTTIFITLMYFAIAEKR